MNIVTNVNVYGLEDAIKGSKYPMATDVTKVTSYLTRTQLKLAQSPKGEGHDNWLNGIIVQFDLTFTNKAWVELERYHFIDFVSSQSTMHRITQFDLDKSYIDYVDPRIVDIMKEKVEIYNELNSVKDANDQLLNERKNNMLKKMYLEILYSNPCGFKLTAKMTTNYRQLKTIYAQRRNHRLPEWQAFCDWVESLPHSELIIGG